MVSRLRTVKSGERALKLYQLYLLTVHLSDNARVPVVIKTGEFVLEVNRSHGVPLR